MADSPNNIEKDHNKYIFKYVRIQSCGNQSLLEYLISRLLRELHFRNAPPQAQTASHMIQWYHRRFAALSY